MPMIGKYELAVLDFETDPFKNGRVPKPFVIEFYSETETFLYWGDDCVEKFVQWLILRKTRYLIYAHNGGKFDFFFILPYVDNPVKIINGRIVKAQMYQHQIRDSLAIIPVPLKKFGGKGEIDYDKMERHVREKHKREILDYLHIDCLELYRVVAAFIDRFGAKLTVGSTAISEIEKRHEFSRIGPIHDAIFRPYYFGGRVQCFASGIIKGPVKAYDVNSMYPYAMKHFKHPINGAFDTITRMPKNFNKPFFMHFKGRNRNAIPVRDEEGGTFFMQEQGEFFACSHEIEVALEYDLIDIDKIIECHVSIESISFDQFVDDFYLEKATAKANGDDMTEMFCKFMLNSGYGKFGQNPDNFQDWMIVHDFGNDIEHMEKGFHREQDFGSFELWAKPATFTDTAYYDVAIASSITSASRATLLRGLQESVDPLYCDTDSIICRDFKGDIDTLRLGAWKLEHSSTHAAIAGKKLYMLYDHARAWNEKGSKRFDKNRKPNPYKLSSKGGTLTPQEMLKICKGKSVEFANQAPTFSLKSKPRFIKRTFKKTA